MTKDANNEKQLFEAFEKLVEARKRFLKKSFVDEYSRYLHKRELGVMKSCDDFALHAARGYRLSCE